MYILTVFCLRDVLYIINIYINIYIRTYIQYVHVLKCPANFKGLFPIVCQPFLHFHFLENLLSCISVEYLNIEIEVY